MIPPKYNFYIVKQLSSHVMRGYVIDSTTGEISSSDTSHSVTSMIDVSGYDTIRLLTSLFSVCQLAQYGVDNTFLGKTNIAKGTSVLTINPKAQYIRLYFYILDDGVTSIIAGGNYVNPHYKELNKKYAKESGQEFFRISLDGKINLFGNDYELVRNSSLEDQMILIIDKYNRTSNKWVEYYKGELNKTDCKFDYDKKKCELKTTAIDKYNEVMNKYDNTYDLIKLAPEITRIDMHKRSLMQVYVRGANSITNLFGGTYWEDDVNEIIDNHNDLINKYYFAYIKAGNEFYVKNAGIEAVNGVYAGINGYWSQWNGYTCYMGTETPGQYAYIYIKRNSDDTILYQSVKQWMFKEEGNCYIGREDIEMVNVNNSADKFTIESPFVYHVYRRLLCDVDTVEDSEGVKNTYNLPSDDFVTDNRNYKKCIGLRGGMFFCTSRAVDEPTKYGLNDYGQYFTNQFIPSTTGIGRALPISKNSWANASLWYVYDSYYEYFEEILRKQYTLKDSYSIGAAIKAILKKIDPTISHEPTAEYSQFLYGNNNPLGLARFYVYITQKTNILKGNYDQPAQKAETSLEELMKMLRDCFRCYWYIEDNKFKIEHISFFMRGGSYSYNNSTQLDFTKLIDQFNKKPSAYFQSEVEYDKSDLNQRYEFGWMDDVTELFGGVTIDVKSNYIQKDKNEEINISQFSSDVDYMLFNPSNFSDDGFALICAVGTNKYIDVTNNIHSTYDGYVLYPQTIGSNIEFGNFGQHSVYVIPEKTKVRISMLSGGKYGFAITDFNEGNVLQYTKNDSYVYTQFEFETVDKISNLYVSTNKIEKIEFLQEIHVPIISVDNLIDENGNSYKAIIQNWYASWIYLQNFYMWDMPARYIESNVIGTLYAHDIKMCMKHTIEFPSEEDLDELELIKTTFGDGKIDEYSVNMNTRTAKVKLTYSPQ